MDRLNCFGTDAGLCINRWGRSISRLTGRSSSAVLGRKYHEVLPRMLEGDRDALSRAVEEQKTLIFREYRFNCLSGHLKAHVKIKPVKATDGRPGGLRVAIVPLTACPAVRELRNSKRLIDIGKMASSLAHGVRNPLNAIKGAVVYLEGKYPEEETLLEFAKLMKGEISRLDNFISKFLSSSLSEADRPEAEINSLLKKTELLTTFQLRSSNIKAVFEYMDVPMVRMNAYHLEQAVLNVINNSIEAMRSGGELAVRSLREKHAGEDFVVIEVKDTGPGMAVGRGGDMPLPLGEKGKGFGLFIASETLNHYGGHLEMKSTRGAGTTARLCLPIKTIIR